MSDRYYLDMDGNTAGPFSLEEVATLYVAGKANDQTLYAKDGSVQWMPLGAIAPLLGIAAPLPPEIPAREPPFIPEPMPLFPRSETVSGANWVCTRCRWFGSPGTERNRSGTVKPVCPSCGCKTLVPAYSPRGRDMVHKLGFEVDDYKPRKGLGCGGLILGVFLIMIVLSMIHGCNSP